MRIRRHSIVVVAGVAAVVCAAPAWAQNDPSAILQTYANAQTNWQNIIAPYAVSLFKGLAAIDFAWTGIVILLEKQDLQAIVATMIKKLMTIGIFYALLVYAPSWFPTIIQSFVQVGSAASGQAQTLNPSDILKQGLTVAATLSSGASNADLLTQLTSGIVIDIACLVIVLSYLVICIHYIMAMVESYIVIGAGYFFLGFGGSRWTSQYVERYVSVVISIGARIMVLYLVIGVGSQFVTAWIAEAQAAAGSATADITAVWNLMCQVVIYAVVCWIVPKIASSVISGTLSVSGGDAIGVGVAAGTAAFAGAATAGAIATGVGAPAALGTAAVGTAGASSAAGGTGAVASAAGATSAAGAGSSLAGGSAMMTGGSSSGIGSGIAEATQAAGSVMSQPPPPAAVDVAPSASSGAGGGGGSGSGPAPAGGRDVVQPLPPSSSTQFAPGGGAGPSVVDQALRKGKETIQGVHGSLPSESATISGAGLHMSHPDD